MRIKLIASVALAAVAFIASGALTIHAATWNAVTDFTTAQNPNGVWTYGYGTAGSSFTAYGYSNSTNFAGDPNLSYWAISQDTVPLIGESTGSSAATCCVTVLVPPGVVWMHPGQSTDTILQFTAPTPGTYSYSGSFALLDTSPTGITGEVFLNTSPLYSGTLTSPGAILSPPTIGASESFSGTVSLNAGSNLLFAVNRDGSFNDDSTALTLTISSAPLPSTWLMLLSGFVGLGFFAYRGTNTRAAALAAA